MKLEKEIIGSCLTYEKCLDTAMQNLRKKHFQFLAPVYEAIVWFYKEGRDFEDIVFDVKERLDGKIKDDTYFDLVNHSTPSITDRAKRLIDRWERKRLKEISDELYNIPEDQPYKETAIKAVHQISELLSGENKTEQTMSQVMSDTVELIENIQAGESLGMKCGLDIDSITGGFQRGQFYILAARPSMGKTALAVQVAQEISKRYPVGFLSLETTNKSLGMRYISNHSGVNGDKMRNGYLKDEDFEYIKESAKYLSSLPIVLDDTTDVSTETVRAKINTMKRKHNIEFLIVDYVQLMKSNRDNREQQVAEISRRCVSVAKEFDICVLGLAQLNRGVESRGGDKRPMLSDLRESGQLEQDAFCVMLLHCPEYYGIDVYPDGSSTQGIAEIIIAKHKDGKTGIKKQLFEKETMRFKNLEKAPF